MDFINKIVQGHTLDVLKEMPDKLVDTCITSPPYWSLRDYQSEPIIWDGNNECEHEWGNIVKGKQTGRNDTDDSTSTNFGGWASWDGGINDLKGQLCIHCNAWNGQLGLEPTIDLYIKHLLQIFNEVGRVMKDEGTLWVVLGDSYGSGTGAGGSFLGRDKKDENKIWGNKPVPGLNKSLCFIPQRFAIGMIDNGFICRNVIIWKKPSCMPSSAKDRFTVDFEYVYFFVKQQKYWFEQQVEGNNIYTRKANKQLTDNPRHSNGLFQKDTTTYGRNKRCVWTINTQPFSEAHFATFPPKLIEQMIKAGCPESVCKKCGKGRERIIETKTLERYELSPDDSRYRPARYEKKYTQGARYAERTEGGLTDCGCDAGWKPGIVLDPFMGAGTTGMVAKTLKRNYVGIELNDEYCKMAEKRIKKQPVAMFG